MALQSMKIFADNTNLCILDSEPQCAIQHTSQPGGQPNARPKEFSSQARFVLISGKKG